jgi:hypothetical protein
VQDGDLVTRQRALVALCKLLHDPEYIAAALNAGVGDAATRLLLDPDETVRIKASELWCTMTGHSLGRTFFVRHGTVDALQQLLDDRIAPVRHNVHECLRLVAKSSDGAQNINERKLIPALVERVASEPIALQTIILETLYQLIRHAAQPALDCNAMAVFTTLLEDARSPTAGAAALAISALSVPFEGKEAAVRSGAVPRLVLLLDSPARAHAASALMSITVARAGKYEAMLNNTVSVLRRVLEKDSVRGSAGTLCACVLTQPSPT